MFHWSRQNLMYCWSWRGRDLLNNLMLFSWVLYLAPVTSCGWQAADCGWPRWWVFNGMATSRRWRGKRWGVSRELRVEQDWSRKHILGTSSLSYWIFWVEIKVISAHSDNSMWIWEVISIPMTCSTWMLETINVFCTYVSRVSHNCNNAWCNKLVNLFFRCTRVT